ncbi:MAG: class I SAM-dependent methyltransferase [Acidiferrobacter sp.]
MLRIVEPEWLDTLAPTDPRARRSRNDLRRLNFLMAHARILSGALKKARPTPPKTLIELGSGDGSLMLTIARKLTPDWGSVHWVCVDQSADVSNATKDGLSLLGWSVECVKEDIFHYLRQDHPADGIVCNLVLHHFSAQSLQWLLAQCARRTDLFMACEPCRSRLSLWSSHAIALIGCNDVTRHDAIASVKAGFCGSELTAHWPDSRGWSLTERGAGAFSHLFVAQRHRDRSPL